MGSVEQRTISAAGAAAAVEAARVKAAELGIAVSVAVVDPAGVLKAFARLDGSPLLSVNTCQQKAYTAVAVGIPTKDFHARYADQPALLGLIGGLPGLAVIGGGVPIYEGSALIGGVGVSGASAEQDAEVAGAAAAAAAG